MHHLSTSSFYRAYPFALGLLSLFVASGCTTIKQSLAPLVCECEAPTPCNTSNSPHFVETDEAHVQVASALAQHQVTLAQDESVLAVEERLLEIQRAEEAYAQRPEVRALETVEPVVESARIHFETEEDRTRFQEDYGLQAPALDDQVYVFRGTFRQVNGEESIAIYEPGVALRIYVRSQIVASLHLGDDDLPVLESQEINEVRAEALDLVKGDSLQIKIIHGVEDEDGQLYYVSIHEQIGQEIGTLFRRPFARRDANGEFHRFADFRFLRGIEHRDIEWIPLDAEGQPEAETQTFKYNHWEGVYRIPEPPPSAPRRENPQS